MSQPTISIYRACGCRKKHWRTLHGSVLVVSHDRYFLTASATKSSRLRTMAASGCSPAITPYYLEKKEVACAGGASRAPLCRAATVAAVSPKASRPRKLSYKEQRELERWRPPFSEPKPAWRSRKRP
ncbi:MAG: hypothetical protein U1G07_15860 [Verrucomicrobiota bacterium]